MNRIRNPNADRFQMPSGYKDIGWQMSGGVPEYNACVALGHNNHNNPDHWREFDNSLYLNRRTNVVTICDKCKLVWHTDMSD